MGIDDWGILIIGAIVLGVVFAPDLLLWPVFYAFGGMMEYSKDRRLVHVGIALALGGPVLVGINILLGFAFAAFGLQWPARIFLATAAFVFLSWVVAGIVVGRMKVRRAVREQEPAAKAELPE